MRSGKIKVSEAYFLIIVDPKINSKPHIYEKLLQKKLLKLRILKNKVKPFKYFFLNYVI